MILEYIKLLILFYCITISKGQFYYKSQSGEVFGPFPVDQIEQWHLQGYFDDNTPISTNPVDQFMPLSKILNNIYSKPKGYDNYDYGEYDPLNDYDYQNEETIALPEKKKKNIFNSISSSINSIRTKVSSKLKLPKVSSSYGKSENFSNKRNTKNEIEEEWDEDSNNKNAPITFSNVTVNKPFELPNNLNTTTLLQQPTITRQSTDLPSAESNYPKDSRTKESNSKEPYSKESYPKESLKRPLSQSSPVKISVRTLTKDDISEWYDSPSDSVILSDDTTISKKILLTIKNIPTIITNLLKYLLIILSNIFIPKSIQYTLTNIPNLIRITPLQTISLTIISLIKIFLYYFIIINICMSNVLELINYQNIDLYINTNYQSSIQKFINSIGKIIKFELLSNFLNTMYNYLSNFSYLMITYPKQFLFLLTICLYIIINSIITIIQSNIQNAIDKQLDKQVYGQDDSKLIQLDRNKIYTSLTILFNIGLLVVVGSYIYRSTLVLPIVIPYIMTAFLLWIELSIYNQKQVIEYGLIKSKLDRLNWIRYMLVISKNNVLIQRLRLNSYLTNLFNIIQIELNNLIKLSTSYSINQYASTFSITRIILSTIAQFLYVFASIGYLSNYSSAKLNHNLSLHLSDSLLNLSVYRIKIIILIIPLFSYYYSIYISNYIFNYLPNYINLSNKSKLLGKIDSLIDDINERLSGITRNPLAERGRSGDGPNISDGIKLSITTDKIINLNFPVGVISYIPDDLLIHSTDIFNYISKEITDSILKINGTIHGRLIKDWDRYLLLARISYLKKFEPRLNIHAGAYAGLLPELPDFSIDKHIEVSKLTNAVQVINKLSTGPGTILSDSNDLIGVTISDDDWSKLSLTKALTFSNKPIVLLNLLYLTNKDKKLYDNIINYLKSNIKKDQIIIIAKPF